MTTHPGTRIEILGALDERYEEILTPDALRLLAALHDKFGERRLAALERGRARRERIEAGADPRFLVETTAIREASEWRVAAPAPGLTRRIVEIVGPTDRRTVQAMLASGADVWVADHEDGLSPTWSNIVEGSSISPTPSGAGSPCRSTRGARARRSPARRRSCSVRAAGT